MKKQIRKAWKKKYQDNKRKMKEKLLLTKKKNKNMERSQVNGHGIRQKNLEKLKNQKTENRQK